jgi:uncharacterized protein with GYD domain
MAKYLFQAGYTSDSWKTQVAKPGSPIDRVTPVIKSCGGQLDCIYYAFGDDDVVGVIDLPTPEAAAAFALAITAGGAMRSFKTTPLLTVEEGIAAMKKAADVGKKYQPPIDLPAAEKRERVKV